jgi:hypothetical protein
VLSLCVIATQKNNMLETGTKTRLTITMKNKPSNRKEAFQLTTSFLMKNEIFNKKGISNKTSFVIKNKLSN